MSDWRIDHSTIPSTRKVKTHQDRIDEAMEREIRLKNLRRRQPQVHASVMAILAEELSFIPMSGGHEPKQLPSVQMFQKVELTMSFDAHGYAGPPGEPGVVIKDLKAALYLHPGAS